MENDSKTRLQIAIAHGRLDVVNLLSANGADVNLLLDAPRARTPSQSAAKYGHREILHELEEAGAAVNRLPLKYAASLRYRPQPRVVILRLCNISSTGVRMLTLLVQWNMVRRPLSSRQNMED